MGDTEAQFAEFVAEATPERRHMMEVINSVIRRVAPELETEPSGRFFGYGPFHYRYASGREGDTCAVGMMNGVQALSLYVMGGKDGLYSVEANAARLGKVSTGKCCIRVKKLEHLNLDVFAELVRDSADQLAAGELGQSC